MSSEADEFFIPHSGATEEAEDKYCFNYGWFLFIF